VQVRVALRFRVRFAVPEWGAQFQHLAPHGGTVPVWGHPHGARNRSQFQHWAGANMGANIYITVFQTKNYYARLFCSSIVIEVNKNDHITYSTYADEDGLKLKTKLCQGNEVLVRPKKTSYKKL